MNTVCHKNKLAAFTQVIKLFALCGLRTRFSVETFSRLFHRHVSEDFTIHVVRDRDGEVFNLAVRSESLEIKVIDMRPKEQQLLLQVCDRSKDQSAPVIKRFLCGKHGKQFVACEVSSQATNIDVAGECFQPVIPRPMRPWRQYRGVAFSTA